MRIIAGEFRGRPLVAPKGLDTRPTIDRVRESLMSSIFSRRGSFERAIVLDAFAGSGALGLEALSRGARFCVLCDNARGALEALRRNAQMAPREAVRVQQLDILHQLPSFTQPFDLVFFDPPYALPPTEVASLILRLDEAGALAPDVLISYEHEKPDDAAVDAAFDALPWQVVKRKAYGKTAIDLLERMDS